MARTKAQAVLTSQPHLVLEHGVFLLEGIALCACAQVRGACCTTRHALAQGTQNLLLSYSFLLPPSSILLLPFLSLLLHSLLLILHLLLSLFLSLPPSDCFLIKSRACSLSFSLATPPPGRHEKKMARKQVMNTEMATSTRSSQDACLRLPPPCSKGRFRSLPALWHLGLRVEG